MDSILALLCIFGAIFLMLAPLGEIVYDEIEEDSNEIKEEGDKQ